MTRMSVLMAGAAILCVAASSCDGDSPLFTSVLSALPALGDAGAMASEEMASKEIAAPPSSVPREVSTDSGAPAGVSRPAPSVESSSSDAGARDAEPDASPAPAPPRPVVVDGAAAELPLLGEAGGDPRLGACPGGVVIGVRTTANPSEEVFGQRLTFIEPICGKAIQQRPDPLADASGTISVTRDDSVVAWAATDGYLGVPSTEPPDPRLTWVLQPATVCPETTPVVVGLSGEYDPIAPDVMDTAAIRSLFIECAPLQLAPNGSDVVAAPAGHQLIANADSFAVPGSATYRSACEGGAVTTQFEVHAGFWLDGFVLGCSRLHVE